MDRLTSLRVFREIVETGSFAAAAKRLGVSAPMASKHVAELEHSSGARLLHRSSRRLSPTDAGERYYAHCRQALEILDAADAEMHQGASTPRGHLKISAPVWCANRRFVDVLARYIRAYPEVVVDLRLENRMVDLVAESFDVALRASLEPSPNLIARKIGAVRFLVVASAEYLARGGGREAGPREIVAPSYFNLNRMFPLRKGEAAVPAPKVVMVTDDSNLSYLSALAGIAAVALPDWMVADDVAAGRLIELKLARPIPTLSLHAVYTSRRFVPLKLRSFIDFFGKHLGADGK